MQSITIKRALISVSDKTNLIPLAQALVNHSIEILSTGGTAKILQEHGIDVTLVEDYTGAKEILGGRVKTLHPKIHAGILARRDLDTECLKELHYGEIDLVVANLYPFAQHQKMGSDEATLVENIDIGGPTLIRAAAKNFAWCTVLVSSSQYNDFINALNDNGINEHFRRQCMQTAFAHVAEYDIAIAQHFASKPFGKQWFDAFTHQDTLRYGENPHQEAAVYTDPQQDQGIAHCEPLQGKALSYNNYNDADTALKCVNSFSEPACVIVKHANPCGVATASSLLEAYQRAFACDPESAFGGIIAFNQKLDKQPLEMILEQQFVEVIIAPDFSDDALTIAKLKPNVRCLKAKWEPQSRFELKSISGGLLVQSEDTLDTPVHYQVVTQKQPGPNHLQDALFAWQVAHFAKSNAIVFAKDQQTLGLGVGQSSRIFATQIGQLRAQKAKFNLANAAMASDAFFPFADNVELAHELGITTIIQPGGSIRDTDVIQKADELNLIMLLTGKRHFKH